jgi:hypothetical protein
VKPRSRGKSIGRDDINHLNTPAFAGIIYSTFQYICLLISDIVFNPLIKFISGELLNIRLT